LSLPRARSTGSSRLAATPTAPAPCGTKTTGGFTRAPAPPRATPVKAERPNDAKRLKQSHDALRTLAIRRTQPRASSGRIAHATRTPVRRRSLTVRVSRGVSALGPVNSLGLGLAPSGRLADDPGNEIRDTSELFLLPYTPSTSTRTRLFPIHRHRLFAGRVPDGMPPIRIGDLRVSRRALSRFGEPSTHWGACWAFLRTRRLTSDAPVAILSRYRCVHFRGARGPIRRDSPRPLPPRRRDATKLFPVKSAFVRREMRCSYSTLSNGDCAPCTPGICPARAPPRVPKALADLRAGIK
jgi:hypothetical protein